MGGEIRQAGEQIHGSVVKPSVAMILSYDSRFAFQIQPNNPRFSYPTHFHHIYRALHDRHVPVDVVAPTADLSAYKLVVARPCTSFPMLRPRTLQGSWRTAVCSSSLRAPA